MRERRGVGGRGWLPLACLLLPASAVAEPVLFLRVDQAGGLDRGQVGASYTLEAARAVLAVEGSADRGDAYRGATHRLSAAYGIVDGLSAGIEQSLKQPGGEPVRLGVTVPELRARLDRLGLPVEGLGTYVQGRIRVDAQRPSSLVGGLILERETPTLRLSARAGFEGTVGGAEQEVGVRAELGAAWKLGPAWRLSAEAWSSTRWVAGTYASDNHAGPALQVRWRALRVGLQLGMGTRSRPRLLILDGVAAARVAVGF